MVISDFVALGLPFPQVHLSVRVIVCFRPKFVEISEVIYF